MSADEKYQEFVQSLETLQKNHTATIFANFNFLRTSLYSNLLEIFKENTCSTNPRVSSALNSASWGGVSVKFDFRSESQGRKSLPKLLLTDKVHKSSISPAGVGQRQLSVNILYNMKSIIVDKRYILILLQSVQITHHVSYKLQITCFMFQDLISIFTFDNI
ncbi:hypothetical protein T4D_16918 [Trichinella pseudospiralis]|uniref:Uncharacterized protein n=1 Tax=Trichinella pseudospiralis TaxID=6337 RepID=A0A0V1G8E6_TRIPS|nr:hypothetical protein T4D_16918 [Trichinella pseudospiralis]